MYHGDAVLKAFIEAKGESNVKILPLSVVEQPGNPFSTIHGEHADVFFCLNALARRYDNFKGINFSTAGYSRKKSDIKDDAELRRVENLNLNIKTHFEELENKNITITAALGNKVEGLEHYLIAPMTVLCGEDWKNVKCVTSVEDRESEYDAVYDWGGLFYYPIMNPPNGTERDPYLVDLRYSKSTNVVAVPRSYGISKYTSFLAPYILARSLNGYSVQNFKAMVLPLEGTRMEIVDLPIIVN